MAVLHYGSTLEIRLDKAAIKLVTEAVASHATRGGWVTTADVDGRTYTFLVTAGIPIWINEDD